MPILPGSLTYVLTQTLTYVLKLSITDVLKLDMDYLRTYDVPEGVPSSDELPYELGTIWPMPGGLAEYARWLTGDDEFIRQIDGELKVIEYLHTNAGMIADRETPYLFIDALNCERGCLAAVDFGSIYEWVSCYQNMP